jgi:hypothetical protein
MRIRTIKPEFWTDELISELSIESRLLFIALWNVSDDEGNFCYLPKQLKIQTLPYDNIDINIYLYELSVKNLIIPYKSGSKIFFNIKNFKKHQKINRPSPPIHPTLNGNSLNPHDIFTDYSLGKEGRKEGKERKGNKEEEEIIIDFSLVDNLFKKYDLEGSLEFYDKMQNSKWLNSHGKPIYNKVNYIIECIRNLKDEKFSRSNEIIKPHKSIRNDEKQLTRAELRKLQKQST